MRLPHLSSLYGFLTKRRSHILCMVMILSTLIGCSVTEKLRFENFKEPDLYQWIEKELSPYLIDQFGQQPRFKGESIVLVAGRDSNSLNGVDQLTAEVRERLMDTLLSSTEINLSRRIAISPDTTVGAHSNMECKQLESSDYQITVEFDVTNTDYARLRVRGLETATGKWVAGFGKSWQGRLRQDQSVMLNTPVLNEELGHRAAPFSLNESDLLAAHLANKLRCVLRDRSLSNQIEIAPDADAQPEVSKVLELVARYLGSSGTQTRVLPVRESVFEATLQLSGSLVGVDGDLHQLWIQLKSKDNKSAMIKHDVNAYVSIRSDMNKLGTESPYAGLLSQLRIKTDSENTSCRIKPYNRRDQRKFPDTPECISLEFQLYKSANVILIRHQVNGMLTRVPIEGCNVGSVSSTQKIPVSDIRVSGLRVRNSEWVTSESIYAIAITEHQLAQQVMRHVLLLPNDCDEIESTQSVDYELEWLARLDEIIDRSQTEMEWKTVNVSG